jgi:transposase
LKGARWALLKNEEDLTAEQTEILRELRRLNEPLWRAHLLKEALRRVFTLSFVEARAALRAWLAWASRSKIPQFVKIAKTVREQLPAKLKTLEHRLSNGRVEAINTSLRLIARRAYGFHSSDAMIAFAFLKHGGLRPALPGRSRRQMPSQKR